MKKLIAISALFVLLATVAFAQPSVGGNFAAKVTIISGSSEEDSPLNGGASIEDANVSVNFANGDGTAGGKVRLNGVGDAAGWWGGTPFAFAWWKPIPQLRIQLGHNPDGDFGAAQITGWGFNAEAQKSVAIDSDSGDFTGTGWKNARRAGFYGGYSGLGAAISIYPMEGLTVNLVLPFGGDHSAATKGVGEIYGKFHLNVVYNLTDIGTVRISFRGDGGMGYNEDYNELKDSGIGHIYGSFFLTAIDDLAVDIGIDFGIPYTKIDDTDISPGLGIGLGVRYTSGDFGVKFRAGATLAASEGDAKKDTVIGVVILPYYTLPAFRFYLNAGFGVSIPDEGDSAVDWFVNPYITKSVSSLTFYAGFKLGADPAPADSDAIVKWAIPIGFNCYF